MRSSSRSLPDAFSGAFSSSLTTTVFSQRSTRWFDISPHRATPKGHNLHLPRSTASREAPIRSSRPRSLRSWHTDITYLPTWQGWLYLATVIDCHTKACIGYAMAEHMRADLVIDALQMAARNYPLADSAIFHSDRGTQYMSQAFAEATAALGVRRSVGRTGSCFDNALAESFNASLKVERVHRTVYPTREHARKDVTRYIEFRYNTQRLHSALGYRTPQEVHDEYLNRQIAA